MSLHWKHKWVPVAARNRDEPVGTESTRFTGEFVKGISTPKTDILYRCECGAVKSDDIHGTWTLKQIQGERGEPNG